MGQDDPKDRGKSPKPSRPPEPPKPDGRRAVGRRVTLDFSGPPLSLPGDEPIIEERDPTGVLTLRSDVAAGQAKSPAKAEPDERPRSEPPGAEPHDAWTVDRLKRSSTMPPPPDPDPDPAPAPQLDQRVADRVRAASPSPNPLPPGPFQGDALGLVDRSRGASGDIDLAAEMADRFALGDFTGALGAAELLLGRDPENQEAKRYAASSRERLEQLYESRLGPMTGVPTMVVPETEVRWLGLDHHAAQVVAKIDGSVTLGGLVDASGMARIDALKILVELLEMKVFAIR